MKKRVMVLGLVLLLLTAVISACGSNGKSEGENTQGGSDGGKSNAVAGEQPKEEAKEQVTLKFYHWYDDKIEKFDMLFAEFEKQYPNIKIESVVGVLNDANETMKKIDLAAASGEEIDVMILNSPTSYAQRAALGLLEPLNDYLSKEGVNYNDEYISDTSIDGKYYALPGKLNQYFVMLNKDQLDAAGLPVPKQWTWDEYLDYAKKLTKGEGATKQYGTYFHTWVDYAMLPLMGQIDNNNLIKSDGTPNVENELFRQGFAIRDRAQKEGSAIPYEDTISQKLHYRNVFMSGQASMIEIGSWMIPEAAGNGPIKQTFKTAFAPYPTAKAGDPIASKTDGDFIAVYSKSKNKEAAYTFAKWLSTEGIALQGKYLSASKKIDKNKVIDALTAGPDAEKLVDKESLAHVLNVTQPAKLYISVPYQGELDKVVTTELEKMLLGDQDLDAAVANARKGVLDLIKANTK
ncbi:MAG TPA: sugar ABC transporter substrate-binding protein [Paenibacillus sp.]|uniref:ABC transporter substrate-binding protein n=1 Tax=Paenibacillus sp. TaxID=58172 RepID=UPI002C4292F2|nr:sugar ABC transporter substrate-binding protein [Paenibacillus sp.]HUC92850.1 sugar ABC transporter substrate-binding protein [Paenibacillus sp.]